MLGISLIIFDKFHEFIHEGVSYTTFENIAHKTEI